eukprot:TRINITY_DN73097_c0_g1_i1.p1 TRINITY_DN73097_c0_g1~~TRINITY_DN73097_c0_g1_i1.p1  ORF type:complete len:609 (-),score=122.79 TRINITY_DN73097_c0_g1_i1:142-1968(-)
MGGAWRKAATAHELRDPEAAARPGDAASPDPGAGVQWKPHRKWEDRKQFLQAGAYIFIWVIGIVAVVKLLTDFASALKPFMLAVVFVSILEVIVQSLEWLQWKLVLFLFLVMFKSWLVFLLLGKSYLQCCRLCCWRLCRSSQPRPVPLCTRADVRDLHANIKDWRRLCLPWDGLFAGKNLFFRFIAVLLTLLIVSVSVFFLSEALRVSITSFVDGDKIGAYGTELKKLWATTKRYLEELPDELTFLSNQTRDDLRVHIDHFENSFQGNRTLAYFESQLVEQLQGIASASSGYLTQLVFFLLYTFLYMFDPLEINTSSEFKAYIDKIYTVFSAFKRERHVLDDAVGSRGSLGSVGGSPGAEERLLPAASSAGASTLRREHSSMELPYAEFYSKVKHPKVGIHRKLNEIIQTYFKLTVFVNLLFASCIWLLLFWLEVDLAVLLAVISFFLAFIPELGIIISVLLPLPIILLSQTQPHGYNKSQVFLYYFLGSGSIKFLVGNVFYTYLMGYNPILSGQANPAVRDIKETHPVIVLLAVVISGEIWGPAGMLLSVPIISLCRLLVAFWYLETGNEAPLGNGGGSLGPSSSSIELGGVRNRTVSRHLSLSEGL